MAAVLLVAGCDGAVTIDESAEWEAVRSSTATLTCDGSGDAVLGEVPDGAIVQVYDCEGRDCQPVAGWRLSYGVARVDCEAPGQVYRMRVLEPVGMRWRGVN